MASVTTKHGPAKEVLHLVMEYSKHARTRTNAYQRVSEETSISVSALRMATKREGLTEEGHSLKYLFSKEEEAALVSACVIYARQGIPLTVKAFIILVSNFAGFEEGYFFS